VNEICCANRTCNAGTCMGTGNAARCM
jgi:hypothetical protein